MKHNKKALLKIAYQRVLAVTVLDIKAPLRWIDTYFADNVCGRGTAADEVFTSKKAFRNIIVNVRRQSKGLVFEAKMLTKYAPRDTAPNTVAFYDEILVKLGNGAQQFTLHISLSLVLVFNEKNWQVISLHASLPDPSSSSTDTFHVEEANKKLEQLERMVAEKTAELQVRNKELEIEAALERVRSKTMAMHNSSDVGDSVSALFDELITLGILTKQDRCGIGIMQPEESMEVWTAEQTNGKTRLTIGHLDMRQHNLLKRVYKAWEEGKSTYQYILKGADKNAYYRAIKQQNNYHLRKDYYSQHPIVVHTDFFFQHGCLYIFSLKSFPEEAAAILERFASLFGQTYTRYLDLQKAEAQAREAIIENAIEKVRSRSLAMHRSEEIQEVAYILGDKLKELGMQMDATTILVFHKTHTEYWIANKAYTYTNRFSAQPESEIDSNIAKDFVRFQPLGENFVRCYTKKEKNAHWRYLLKHSDFKNIPEDRKRFILDQKFYNISVAFAGEISLTILRYDDAAFSDEDNQLIARFAKVFAQAYTRFTDLQTSEHQAREAQIEASLERVRSVAMGMRKATDLLDICETSYAELMRLGFTELRNTMINIHDDAEETFLNYDYSVYAGKSVTKYGYHIHPVISNLVTKSRSAQDAFVEIGLHGREFAEWKKFRRKSGEQDDARLNSINHLNYYFYSIGIGSIGISTFENISERKLNTLKRFRNVFQLAYQRFTDLTLAEAQAREAQIETALERVRARTMAMQNSSELPETVKLMFHEFRGLLSEESRQIMSRGFITTIQQEHGCFDLWITETDGSQVNAKYEISFQEKTTGIHIHKAWRQKKPYIVVDLQGDELNLWLDYLAAMNFAVAKGIRGTRRVNSFVYYSNGFIGVTSALPLADESIVLLQRFAKVFDQTYTRFLDLQIAEAAAKEAIKQAALDRIRANIASMRTVEDLDRITPVIWNELLVLGIPFVRCGIFIMDESQQQIHTFLSSPDGGHIAAYYMRFQETSHIYAMVEHWRKHAKFIERWTLREFEELATSLYQQTAIKDKDQYLQSIPADGMWLHFIPFMQGMLYVGNESSLPEDAIDTLAAVADAFSTAYARYEDFNKLEQAKTQVEHTLVDLKQAQKQLVQSEKMASLGELTAGIAHEIQNPLNFVNNFSEVTQELLEELRQELKQGNEDAVQDLMDDIIQNLEKINHHGKRADGIVKGMLQHSRTSSGQKELVDINILCDEYLRLSYHGLRAKDKSFNAKFETSLDNTIPKIHVMPQEMGRVILNLINNAFYAVNKMQQKAAPDYVPTVRLVTQMYQDKIQISVEDNGSGIPEHIKDKIFQPFFTTKPTGEGTGLGLSLSYDIVKAHGGELSLETELGRGTTFHIVIPA